MLAAVMLLAACEPAVDGSPSPSPSAAPDDVPTATATGSSSVPVPDPTGGGILRYALGADPLSIDPRHVADPEGLVVVDAVFDGLVRLDSRGEAIPAAATTWVHGPGPDAAVPGADGALTRDDASVLTFTLRDGARFHDGSAVDADAFVRGFTALVDGTVAAPSPFGYLLEDVVGYAETAATGVPLVGVVALDPLHLQVRFVRPAVDALTRFSHPALVPLPAGLDTRPEDDPAPIGNGPFLVVEDRVPEEFVRVARAPGWGLGPGPTGDALLDEVIFRVYSGDRTGQAQFEDLLVGRVDVALVPASRREEAVARFGRAPRAYEGPGVLLGNAASTYLLGVDTTSARFGDVAVRRAVLAGLDTDLLAALAFGETRTPLHGLVPPGVAGARRRACELACALAGVDPVAALLADGGVLPADLVVSHPSGAPHDAVAAAAAAELIDALGIPVVADPVPALRYVQTLVDAPPAGPFRLGWEPDVPTPAAVLVPQFHSRAAGRTNLTRFADPAVDALLDLAARTPGRAARNLLLARAEDLVLASGAVVPVATEPLDLVVAADVRGLVLDPLRRPDLGAAALVGPSA